MLGVAGKCRVKASVHVIVKQNKGGSPVPEPVPEPAIKDGKGKISCLLDGEKISVHAKTRGDSWEMEKSEGSQHFPL